MCRSFWTSLYLSEMREIKTLTIAVVFTDRSRTRASAHRTEKLADGRNPIRSVFRAWNSPGRRGDITTMVNTHARKTCRSLFFPRRSIEFPARWIVAGDPLLLCGKEERKESFVTHTYTAPGQHQASTQKSTIFFYAKHKKIKYHLL